MANTDTIRVGSRVEIRDGELEEAWRIVDPAEADPGLRHISIETPLARALLGHQVGDQVPVQGPEAQLVVMIVHVG